MGGDVLITHALDTLALARAGFGPVGFVGSRLFGDAGRGLFAWCAWVRDCRWNGEVRGGTGCFGFLTDFGDAFRDCTGGGTLDSGSLNHLF